MAGGWMINQQTNFWESVCEVVQVFANANSCALRPMPTRRQFFPLTPSHKETRLYAVGGCTWGGGLRQDNLKTVESFDLYRNRWSPEVPMNSERCGAAASCFSHFFLFAFCGQDQHYNRLKCIERLSLSRREDGWKLFHVKRRSWIQRAYNNATQLPSSGNILIFGRYFSEATSFEYRVTSEGTIRLVTKCEFPAQLSVYNLFKRGPGGVHCIDWVGNDNLGWKYQSPDWESFEYR